MNIEKSKMQTALRPVITREQINLETEIVLPDYFDSIGKILNCTVKPRISATSPSSDRLNIDGYAVISILYMGEDKKLYNYSGEIKYTRLISGNSVEFNDNYYLEQNLSSLNYRAIGPKKIDIKCIVEIVLNHYKKVEFDYVSKIESENVFDKKHTSEIESFDGLFNRSFYVQHDVTLETQSIKSVIRYYNEVEIAETKILQDKMFIKGMCKVNMVYITQEDNIDSLIFDVPFSEVLDIYGIKEDSECNIINISSFVVTDNNFSVDTNQLHFNVEISLNIMLTNKTLINIIDDVYSVKNELDTNFTEILLLKSQESVSEKITVSFTADSFIEDNFIICDSFVDNIRIKHIKDNTFEFSGQFNSLIKLSDNSYSVISRSYNTEFNVNKEICFTPEFLCCKVLSESALQSNDSNIKFTIDLIVNITGSIYYKEKILTNIAVTDKAFSKKGGIILYYAENGESMWDIAKENRSSVSSIKELNGISEDMISEKKILLITKI